MGPHRSRNNGLINKSASCQYNTPLTQHKPNLYSMHPHPPTFRPHRTNQSMWSHFKLFRRFKYAFSSGWVNTTRISVAPSTPQKLNRMYYVMSRCVRIFVRLWAKGRGDGTTNCCSYKFGMSFEKIVGGCFFV